MESWLWYVLVGLLVGVFSSLFGVGGGIILVPTLVLAFAWPQKAAQGTALALMVPMALVGAIRYYMNPAIHMDLRTVAFLAAGGVVGALIGAQIVTVLPGALLRKLFAFIMVAAAVNMFLHKGRQGTAPDDGPQQDRTEAVSGDAK